MLGLLDVDDEFFVLLRPTPGGVSLMVSDAVAALDYDVAADVLDLLRVELPADDDVARRPAVAGGRSRDPRRPRACPPTSWRCSPAESELYPDEQLAAIGRRCGFGDALAEVVDGQ